MTKGKEITVDSVDEVVARTIFGQFIGLVGVNGLRADMREKVQWKLSCDNMRVICTLMSSRRSTYNGSFTVEFFHLKQGDPMVAWELEDLVTDADIQLVRLEREGSSILEPTRRPSEWGKTQTGKCFLRFNDSVSASDRDLQGASSFYTPGVFVLKLVEPGYQDKIAWHLRRW